MTSAHPHVDALAIALAVSHGLDELAPAQVSATMARTAQRHAIKAARTCWRDAVTAPHAVPVDELGQVGRNARTFALEVLDGPSAHAGTGDPDTALRTLRAAFRTWAVASIALELGAAHVGREAA